MYDYYFGTPATAPDEVPAGPNVGYFDTVNANRYNVQGSKAYISGTTDSSGLVVTAGGSNQAIVVDASGEVTIKDLNVSGRILIDGDPLQLQPSGTGTGSTVGQSLMMYWGYQDVLPGNTFVLTNNEPGAGASVGINFPNGFLPYNNSDEALDWSVARLIFRGRVAPPSGTVVSSGSATLSLLQFKPLSTTYQVLTPFVVRCENSTLGYTTCVTPWFKPTYSAGFGLSLKVHATPGSHPYRFGPVYIQFGSERVVQEPVVIL